MYPVTPRSRSHISRTNRLIFLSIVHGYPSTENVLHHPLRQTISEQYSFSYSRFISSVHWLEITRTSSCVDTRDVVREGPPPLSGPVLALHIVD